VKKLGRADNVVLVRLYIDKDLRNDFKKYATLNDSDMTKEMVKFIERYNQRNEKKYMIKELKGGELIE